MFTKRQRKSGRTGNAAGDVARCYRRSGFARQRVADEEKGKTLVAQLPATYREFVEAEALAFARDWIADHRKPNGIFHPDATAICGKALMKRWAQAHPFGADDIVYFAKNGSPEADRALRELIAEHVNVHQTLPAVLAAYNIRIMNDSGQRKPGPAKTDNFLRDIGITLLVEELVKRYFPRLGFHQNPQSQPSTVTKIAAEALTDAKIGIVFGPKGVAKIGAGISRSCQEISQPAISVPSAKCSTSSAPNLGNDKPAKKNRLTIENREPQLCGPIFGTAIF